MATSSIAEPTLAGTYGGKGPLIMGITWAETSVALVLVMARLFGASIRRGELRWDFLWVAVASVFGIVSQSLLTVATAYGIGKHIWELTLDDIAVALKYYWASASVGLFAIVFAKIAIIALLIGVQGPQQKKRGYFLHFLWITNALFAVAMTTLIYTQCNPTAKIWDVTIISGNCNLRSYALQVGYAQGTWAALTDIILAIYPIFVVWDLQTSLRMKIGFCALMSGGLIAAIGGTFRTFYIHTLNSKLDATYDFASFMIWGGTELWCIIILGSIPPLRPLFLKFFRKAKLISNPSYPSRPAAGEERSHYGAGITRITTDSKRSALRSQLRSIDIDRERSGWRRNRSADKMATATDWEDDEHVLIMPKDGIVVQSTFEMVETTTNKEDRPKRSDDDLV